MRFSRIWPLTMACCLAAHPVHFQEAPLHAHMAFLADDVLEGRGTGQRGGELAVRYLATQLQAMGLHPGHGKSYLQPVALRGISPAPGTQLTLHGPQGEVPFILNQDAVVGGSQDKQPVDAPLVFVGHATRVGPRDDFKGMDVKGKILVCFVGPVPECAGSSGDAIHYAGRWRAKLELGERLGAAGVLLIHTDTSAGYGWAVPAGNYQRERFQLADYPTKLLSGWLTEATTRRLLQVCGKDFDALKAAADRLDFQPFSLPLTLKGMVCSQCRTLLQQNVVGLVPGKDPHLKAEALVLSAHWDHLGKDASGAIYNGAVDNGSACAAMLSVAQVSVKHPTQRSQIYLFPCAEEAGMLGAEAFVKSNLWPRNQIIANLNFESLNVWGPTQDIGLLGADKSTLYETALQVCQSVRLKPAPKRPDPTGLFFRSDHFPFVQAGIPAFSPGFSLEGGWQYLDPKQGEQANYFVQHHYHKPSDRYDPTWDLRGLVQQVHFFYQMGQVLGNADKRPAWKGQSPTY